MCAERAGVSLLAALPLQECRAKRKKTKKPSEKGAHMQRAREDLDSLRVGRKAMGQRNTGMMEKRYSKPSGTEVFCIVCYAFIDFIDKKRG